MFLCIPHQSLMMRQSGKRNTPHLKNAASAPRHDSQETARLDEDSEHSSVVVDRISPTPASQVLSLTWQRDMWLHVRASNCDAGVGEMRSSTTELRSLSSSSLAVS